MLPDKVIFNQELDIDLVWIDRKPVNLIVSTNKHLQNGVQIRTKREEEIWLELVEGWDSFYVGSTNVGRLDQEES